MNNNTLKLPDNVEISTLLHSEILDTSQQNEESLSLSRFMDSLQLIYSVDYSFDLRYCFQLMNLFPTILASFQLLLFALLMFNMKG
ncbi:hypothetical protein OIU74_020055 [Salix koriyanagi]|uniref:Transmembrane protein n=1 Tax=Salix koriyanagi TaxID=2511006 RepID=A0A9Q0P589_9ROSI|nr:hypothetical protein OIU74_020055 [Salix koriyanagi]